MIAFTQTLDVEASNEASLRKWHYGHEMKRLIYLGYRKKWMAALEADDAFSVEFWYRMAGTSHFRLTP